MAILKKVTKKVAKRINTDNEKGARQGVLEDLFYDFNRQRYQVYWMNFVRGIFFGFGSVLGGTLLVAVTIWSLNTLGVLVPALADFVDSIVNVMKNK